MASKDDVKMMKLHLEQLDERWRDLPQIISKRLDLKNIYIIHFLSGEHINLRKQSFYLLLRSQGIQISIEGKESTLSFKK